MQSVNRAIFLSFSNKYLSLVLDLGLVVIVSRIMSPADLGIYSLALGSISIGQMLREFGLSTYIIKEKDLSEAKIQGCFSISTLICWFLGSLYFLSAGVIGDFYENSEVTTLVQILSVNFFLLPFSTLIISLFQRELRFGANMLIITVGTIVRVVSTLVLLYFDTSIISLAWGGILGTASNLIFAIYYGEWKYYKFNFKFVKEIAGFTSFVSLSNIINRLGIILPEAIIGKFLSMEKVAYFGKGLATVNLFKMLFLSVIASVVSPVISKLNHQNVSLNKSIYALYDYILVLHWPFYLCVILFAEDIVTILYGSQWGEVVRITQVMAFFILFEGFILLSDRLLNIMGEVKFSFAVSLTITTLQVSAVFLFINQGFMTVVYAVSSFIILKVIIVLPKLRKVFKLSGRTLMTVYFKNALIAIIVFLWGSYTQYLVQDLSILTRTVLNILSVSSIWLLLIFTFRHPLKIKIIDVFKILSKPIRQK